MATPAFILEGTELNFDTLVIDNSRKGLVVVDFWAPWAGPSLRQRQVLRRLAEAYQGRFLLVTIDTDRQKAVASRFGVKSLPSCKLFRHGRIVQEVHGMQPEADYRAIVEQHLVPLGDQVRLSAARAWNAGERDRAIQVLAEGATADPDDLAIPAMLAKLLMRMQRYPDAREVLLALPPEARDHAELASLLAHVDFISAAQSIDDEAALRARLAQSPPDLAAHFDAAALHLVRDEYAAALDALLVILRADRDYRQGAAQRGLLAIFDTLGAEHPLVRRCRGELARLIH